MKRLCCSKMVFLFLFLASSLFASLHDKSAIIYYGEKISYPMVGIHDYIIVKPKKTNVYTHGFSLYKHKMYASVELDDYFSQEGVFEEGEFFKDIESLQKRGFENFLLEENKKSTQILKTLYRLRQKNSKMGIFLKSDIDSITRGAAYLNGAVFESAKRSQIKKALDLGLEVIDVEYVEASEIEQSDSLVEKIESMGAIPYVSAKNLNSYGKSSKNALKREILTLINESKNDRMLLSAHQHGALALEYNGYIQKLYNVENGLPDIESIRHYAGVIIWLSQFYDDPIELVRWVLELHKMGIKVVFASNFGANLNGMLLQELGIDIYDSEAASYEKKRVVHQDKMIGFEVEPSINENNVYMQPEDSEELLTYKNSDGLESTPVAITPWGGYAISEAFMLEINEQNLWVVNPFEFFMRALRLKKLLVPDTTTENGNRLMFSHIDGDGIMNYVESNPEYFSGDMIYEKILKVYQVPHSVSVIGAEINPDGLFPKLSQRLMNVARKMYSLDNVEPATHTFTHPFKWGKIVNDDLDPKYRLKVKNYDFSLRRELTQTLEEINSQLVSKKRVQAKSVFWSGDCAPRKNALEYVYKHKILNINGGDTVITNAKPWLTNVAPLGLQRDEYYQIYTGAQNENVYTNDWLGPFWGFKKVVQTFKLTNSPRRLKPIDIYYHIYSGSKIASLNALRYVFDWSLKQDVMPIFTSAYIPKVMDYFAISIANEKDEWLFDGMRDLKTLRIEDSHSYIDLKRSDTIVGKREFENHTYLSLDQNEKHYIVEKNSKEGKNQEAYLIAANAKVLSHRKGISSRRVTFKGDVPLKLEFYIPKGCTLKSDPSATKELKSNERVSLWYQKAKEARVDVFCKQ